MSESGNNSKSATSGQIKRYQKRRHLGIRGVVGGTDRICEMLAEIAEGTKAEACGPCADAGYYARGGMYNGDGLIARAGAGAGATTGRAEANAYSFGAYAEGPSAGAGAEAYHLPGTILGGFNIGGELSLAKAGVKAGPLAAEANLNLNTGISVSPTRVSAAFLGFGFSAGSEWSFKTPIGKISLKL